MARRIDTSKFRYHRDVPVAVTAFNAGEVVVPWKKGIHKLEATTRVRWNRLHEQFEVLAADTKQRARELKAVQRLPVGKIAAQARRDLLAERDQCWIDPTFTSL